MPQGKIKILLPIFISLCIALLTYVTLSPLLKCDFTNMDDGQYVLQNPLVTSNTVQLEKILKTPVWGNYHPVTMLTLAWNYQSGKLDPRGYHLWNLLLHTFNTVLVFVFIFLLTNGNMLMASLVAVFFGIHPMHVDSVGQISERKDVLYVFFFLLALISYLYYRRASHLKKYGWYFAMLLMFILSGLSKAMAVIFPVILLLIDYYLVPQSGSTLKQKINLIVEKIPLFILSLVFGIISYVIQQQQGMMGLVGAYTIVQRIMLSSYSATVYLVKLFIPYELCSFYPLPYPTAIDTIFYLSPFILAGIIVAMYFLFRENKAVIFGLLFFAVAIIPVLPFNMVGYILMGERFTYLSYIGLLFAVAYLINSCYRFLEERAKSNSTTLLKYALSVFILIYITIFCFQSYARTNVWMNSDTVWTDLINKYPERSDVGYSNRGAYFGGIKKDYKRAMEDFAMALKLHPDYAEVYKNRGLIFLVMGDTASALGDFNSALKADSKMASEMWLTRARVYAHLGQDSLAFENIQNAFKMDSTDIAAHYELGKLYYKQRNYEAALNEFSTTLKYQPTYVSALSDRGVIYFEQGKNDLALNEYNQALSVDSNHADTHYNRGLLYHQLQKLDLAINDYSKAIALNQHHLKAGNNRGLIYLNQSKYNLAISDFSNAIASDSNYAEAYFNRGLAYNASNNFEKSLTDFLKYRQLAPADADGLNILGQVYLNLKKPDAAVAEFTKAITLNPAIAVYYYNRARAETELGRNAEARADALKAQQLGLK